ncbi:hypothetical protein M9H77_28939 [Catharanthus roseus]|uniref:Uncharacterized protein n=2 Tax=Catharanthus roseus TaxID=4058 RepID=A0ACC0AHD4_CATRO|nr:putative universal stress protein [Catharanthus roseus]KAI5660146.1 hypothetical protein M9H77_28939 [Catharanthus roseus]
MDSRKIVVIVEDVEIARTALQWTLQNLLRYGDLITLLHVFPSTRSRNKKKLRLLRLKGFQLALSFKDICCNNFPNTKTEIVVTEGDEEGGKIATMVREIGASTLVVGLHDQSFLYKLAMAPSSNIGHSLNCKVLGIKQPASFSTRATISVPITSPNMDFSQIEISSLSIPQFPATKVRYQICPDPYAIIWRSGRSRRRST